MAAENFKVKKGLEVGTGITANSDGVNVTGIVTATQFKGDGSGLTGVVGSGSGIVVKDEGSAVGTAGTVNFVGSGVAATLSAGTATVTINAGGLDNVVEDTTPQLGGNLDLNSKFITGSGGINVTGVVTATTLKGNGDFVDIDVDGQTELDELNVAGITTFNANVDVKAELTANKLILDDDGSSSPTLTIAGDDENVFGMVLVNDTYKSSPAAGFKHTQLNNGEIQVLLRANNSATRLPYKIQQGNAPTGLWDSFTIDADGAVKLGFGGNQKLITTINGIEVPDLNVTGVGTVGRLDTNGVTLGTNNNTFAAKFIDDAVANFGTDNDLKISHDDTHARITNTKGNIVVSGIISATSDVKVGSAITMDPTSGIITATKFSGDGSLLTGITASGSGILVKHDGSNVGTAGTINFSTNLDVTPISAGIVTVTASGGSGATDKIEEGDTKVETVDSGDAAGAYVTTEVNGTEEIRTIGGQTTIKYLRVGSNWNMANTTGNGISLQFSNNHDLISSSATSGIDIQSNSSIELGQNGFPNHQYASISNSSAIFRTTNTERFRVDASGIQVGQNAVSVGATITIGGNATFAGIVTATTFSGALASSNLTGALPAISGANLTSLNADNLGSGEIPNGRFPATLPAVSGANLTNVVASNITLTANNDSLVYRVPFASANTGSTALYSDGDITYNPNSGTLSATVFSGSGASLTNLPSGQLSGALPAISGANLTNLPVTGISTAPSNVTATWSITASDANGYEFTGPGQDGSEDDPDIYLMRGHKYRFVNTTGSSHPFEFRNAANDADYTDGITGSQSGTQEFSVQHDAPAALKYRCTIHTGNMLGNIYIVGQHLANGANNRVLTATSAYGMNGEQFLTFDGTTLDVTGDYSVKNPSDASYITHTFASNFAKIDVRGTNIANSNHYLIGYGAGHGSANDFHIVNTVGELVLRNGSGNALEVDSNRNLKATAGNFVAATSGKGIDYSAHTASNSTSSVLNDYKEGTWTASVTDFNGTYSYQNGYYTKIGSLVHVDCIIIASGGSGTGSYLRIGTLPFDVTSASAYRAVGNIIGINGVVTGGDQLQVQTNAGLNYVQVLRQQNNGAVVHLNRGSLNSGGWEFQMSITYRCDT